MKTKIDITVNDKTTRTFETIDGARKYLDLADSILADFVPSASEPTPELTFPTVTSPSISEEPEPTQKTPGNRINRDIAMAVYQKLARYGKRKVKSSTFRVRLVAETGCTEISAQHWVWKLNQVLPPAGKIRLDHKRIS